MMVEREWFHMNFMTDVVVEVLAEAFMWKIEAYGK